MTINDSLTLIATFAIFMEGYYFRRKNMVGILLSGILTIFQLLAGIFINGLGTYGHTISTINLPDFSFAIAYTLFWFLAGYIVGGIKTNYQFVNKNRS